MIESIVWRLAAHPADQAALDAFRVCSKGVGKRKGDPSAEAQAMLRHYLRAAARDSGNRDWRYLLGEDSGGGGIVAAFIHRAAPDFQGPPFPKGVELRLLGALGIRHDLRGQPTRHGGGRISDQTIDVAVDDARRSVGGFASLLLARVGPSNVRAQRLLERHRFAMVPDDAEYLTYAISLAQG